MLCRQKLSPRRKKLRRIVYIIIAFVVILSLYFELAVKSQLTGVIEAELKTLAQRAMNSAVAEFLDENPEIGEGLTVPHYGDSGIVSSITSDPSAVNYLKATISEMTQDKIEALCADGSLSVPLGCFTGFELFMSFGPEIPIEIGSRQTVSCSLKSSFESAGVNQTLHHVILNVEAEMTVYNPFKIRRVIRTSADFEIAQTVIVGSVPSYTLGAIR